MPARLRLLYKLWVWLGNILLKGASKADEEAPVILVGRGFMYADGMWMPDRHHPTQ